MFPEYVQLWRCVSQFRAENINKLPVFSSEISLDGWMDMLVDLQTCIENNCKAINWGFYTSLSHFPHTSASLLLPSHLSLFLWIEGSCVSPDCPTGVWYSNTTTPCCYLRSQQPKTSVQVLNCTGCSETTGLGFHTPCLFAVLFSSEWTQGWLVLFYYLMWICGGREDICRKHQLLFGCTTMHNFMHNCGH